MLAVVLSYLQKPVYQGLFFLALNTVTLPVVRPSNVDHVYTVSGIIYLLFIVTNSLFVFSASAVWPYFFYSLLCSAAYIMSAYFISNSFISYLFKYEGSGESSMIFLAIIYHPLLLLMIIFIQWIYVKLTK